MTSIAETVVDWLSKHEADFSVFFDTFDAERLTDGFALTISISVISLFFSVLIGVVGALLQTSSSRSVRGLIYGYTQFFRNTPPLVQLYFFYFAVSQIVSSSLGQADILGNTYWAIVAFSLFAGAFNVEIFRAGLEAVPKTTVEATESLGFNRTKAYALIIFPLALRISFPALTNNLVNLIKTTTLAYAIGVPELLYVSAQIWSERLNVFFMMNFLLVAYILIVGVLVIVMHFIERMLRVPGMGRGDG